jgi:hypothetical protein
MEVNSIFATENGSKAALSQTVHQTLEVGNNSLLRFNRKIRTLFLKLEIIEFYQTPKGEKNKHSLKATKKNAILNTFVLVW